MGGIASATTINSGGTLELYGGGSLGGGPLIFAGIGGTLTFDTTSAPDNVLSGFTSGDAIDFVAQSFPAIINGVFAVTSGNELQVVVSGGSIYDLQLDPSQNFSSDCFLLSAGILAIGLGHPSTVSSGQTVSNTSATIGTVQLVSGTASGTRIESGGAQTVASGGIASATSDGGFQYVFGTADVTNIGDDGWQYILAGGNADGATVSAGGFQEIDFGGVATSTTMSGGLQDIYSGGAASATSVVAGTQTIYSGGTAISTTLVAEATSFNTESVNSGGTAIATTIGSKGQQYVSGAAIGTIVNSGGNEYVVSGGVVSGTVATLGGSVGVYAGGTAIGTIISGGTLELFSGGSLGSGAVKFAGANGTLAVDTTSMPTNVISGFAPGDVITLSAVSFASGSVTPTSGNELVVSVGGRTYDLQLDPSQSLAGDQFELLSGSGDVTEIVVAQTGVVSSGQTVSNTSVGAGAGESVYGTTVSTTIQNGGQQIIYASGLASITTVSSGGYQEVDLGGTAIATTADNGGQQTIMTGGIASGAIISSGGVQTISSGGAANGSIVSFGGAQAVSAGGTANSTTISSGDQQVFGLAIGTVNNSGQQFIEFGGVISDTTLSAADLYMYPGGSAVATSIGPYSEEQMYGGVASNTSLSGVSDLEISGGTAINTTISNGGAFYVELGGIASGVTVGSSGDENIYPGGTASGSIIDRGGSGLLLSGGTILDMVIDAGGVLTLGQNDSYIDPAQLSGLTDSGGAIDVDGTLTLSGSVLSVGFGTTLGEVSIAGVLSGAGTIAGPIGDTGTIEVTEGNTLVVTGAVSGGGQLVIDANANLILGGGSTTSVDFAGANGSLTLESPASFTATISGLAPGDTIDLANTNVTSAVVSATTLMVTEASGQTLSYEVVGAFSGNSISLVSDNAGGTELVLSTTSPYDAFENAANLLGSDALNNLSTSQIAADGLNVFIDAIAGAIGTLGGTNWQLGYENSSQAATTISADLIGSASTQQLLIDTLNLYDTIVAGAVGSIAAGASQTIYNDILQAAETLSTDIANDASESQFQSDVGNLYDVIAGSAVSSATWQQAESSSDQAAATLSADITSGASSKQISSDATNLYQTIVSGSLGAVGGSALQQAYADGGDTISTIGTDIANTTAGVNIQQNVAETYNSVISFVDTTTSAAAQQNYSTALTVADDVASDIANNNGSSSVVADTQSLYEVALPSIVGMPASDMGGYEYVLSAYSAVVHAYMNGGSIQDADQIATNFFSEILGPSDDSEWQQFQTLAAAIPVPSINSAPSVVMNYAMQVFSEVLTVVGTTSPSAEQAMDQALEAGISDIENSQGDTMADLQSFIDGLFQGGPPLDGESDSGELVQQWSDALGGDAKIAGAAVLVLYGSMAITGTAIALPAAIPLIAFGAFVLWNVDYWVDHNLDPSDPRWQNWHHFKQDPLGYFFGPPYHYGKKGGARDDVHITTYSGLDYSFQAAGEFILTQSTLPGDSFQIQVRLQPIQNNASVSEITMIGAQVGTDRVTFGVGRADEVWVDGSPSALSPTNTVLNLNGGQLVEVSPGAFQLTWATGESMTVSFDGGNTTWLNVSVSLGPLDGPGTIQGLLGPDEGQANDFELANGTVLSQSLTSAELYGEYANAWRVTQANSLLDYGSGQTTATFTNLNFPANDLTLSDFPTNLVNQALAMAAAAGITDPNLADDAALDYLATGDLGFITAGANAQQQENQGQGANTTTAAIVTPSTPPPVDLGVAAVSATIVESPSGQATPVTFEVYLTGDGSAGANTVVDFSVVSGGFFDAATFGGTLPSGSVTISSGGTAAEFSIDVPANALGAEPSQNLEVQISSTDETPVLAADAESTIVNNQPEPGPSAVPTLGDPANLGIFTSAGNAYTLDLGAVPQGAEPQIQIAIANDASAPADELSGNFIVGPGNSITFGGDGTLSPIAAGQIYEGLVATLQTGNLGANSQTLTFTPQDLNDSGYSALLSDLTLTINYTVELPAEATLSSPMSINFGNLRVGAADSQAVSVTNSAIVGAASLDASFSLNGGATGSGTINQLAPGATDATDLSVGLNTSDGGPASGVATIDLESDSGDGITQSLNSQSIDVFGSVYRPGTPSIPAIIAHVGAPTTQTLAITNNDPNDGYSENLIATVVSSTGSVTTSGTTTGDIAPQATSDAISVGYSTASVGEVGTVTLDFITDGGTGSGSIDGLETEDLGSQTYSITVDNYATAAFEVVSGGGTLTQTGSAYTLNLGTVLGGGTPLTLQLGVVNGGGASADLLSGTFATSGDSVFTNTSFGAFSGLSGGQSDPVTVVLDTTNGGNYNETITLDPTDYNADGYSSPLGQMTLTISADVVVPNPLFISSGRSVSGFKDSAGQFLEVQSGGSATGTIVSSGGALTVSSGGTANNTTVSSSGTLTVLSGGLADPTTIYASGTETVSAGGTDNGALISGGGQFVYGLASGASVFAGGLELVESGGTASNTTVSSGGQLYVTRNATASGTTVGATGIEYVFSGGVDSGTILIGGVEIILAGGSASGSVLSGGGIEAVYGSAVGAVVQSDGAIIVSSGGVASGTSVSGGGLDYVSSGGADTGTMLSGGGVEIVSAGGTASRTIISSGGEAVYGSAVSAAVQSGGALIVSSGGMASVTTVRSGGLDYVLSGGVDSNTMGFGGIEVVSAGGTASGTVLSGGAEADLGRAVSATLLSGAALIVYSGGVASGTRLISAGTIDYVLSGGSDSGTTGSGGIEVVSSGGTASATTLSGGAEADLGRVVNATLQSGAALIVYGGGVASGTHLISAGTIDYVLSGGVDSGTTATGGIEVVSAGGTASGTILSGGAEALYGKAVSATVQSGGILIVSSGGAASGTRLSAGGDEYVLSGGVDSGTTAIGGTEVVSAGGTASGTILSGGAEQLYGSAVGATVQSGGVLIVFSGGTASGTQLSAGGVEYVLSEGIDSGTTFNGGTEVVSAGGTASGTVLSGGAEAVYGSAVNATVQANGFLIVSSGGVASGATLSSGGTGLVSSDGTAVNTTVLSGGYELAYSGGLVSGATLSGGQLELQSGGSGSGTFDFASGGLLTLDGIGSYGMLVAGFTSATAQIDLTDIAFAGLTSSSLSWTPSTGSGTLTISSGVNSASILLLGTYTASDFSVKADSGTGTIVYDPPQIAEANTNPLTTPHQA